MGDIAFVWKVVRRVQFSALNSVDCCDNERVMSVRIVVLTRILKSRLDEVPVAVCVLQVFVAAKACNHC